MKPNEDYHFNPYVIEDLDYEISPVELIQDVGVLVMEGRLPEFSLNGRCEGEHCWPVSLDSKKDCCLSNTKDEASMCNFVQSVRGKLRSMWTEALPAFIEVLVCLDSLFPSNCSKPEPCEIYLDNFPEINAQKILLLERWKLEVYQKETLSSMVNINMMLQAVRSFLHFSQLSAWFIQTGGRMPSRIFYRIIHGEPESWIEFNQQPEIHEFPKALTSRTHCIKVTSFSLPRIDLDTLISMSPYKEFSVIRNLPYKSRKMADNSCNKVSGSFKPEALCSDFSDSEETPPKCTQRSTVFSAKCPDAKYITKPFPTASCKNMKMISTTLRQKLSFDTPMNNEKSMKPNCSNNVWHAKDMQRRDEFSKDCRDEQTNAYSANKNCFDHQNEPVIRKKTFFVGDNEDINTSRKCNASDEEHCNGFNSKHCNGFKKLSDQSDVSANGYCFGFEKLDENGTPCEPQRDSFGEEKRMKSSKDETISSSTSSLSEQISNCANSHQSNGNVTCVESKLRGSELTVDELNNQEIIEKNGNVEHSQSCRNFATLESKSRASQVDKLRRSESCCSTRPRPISMAARLSLGACTVPVFHPKTGLPVASSPAPLRKPDKARANDIRNLVEDENLLQSSIEICKQRKPSTGDYISQAKLLSRSAPASTRLLGNFEESVLKGRMPVYGTVEGFSAEIGASGSFCPDHITMPIRAHFFRTSDDNAPSPYLGHIPLRNHKGKKGYHVPRKGTVQLTIFNPNKTVVKVFFVLYDFSDMPSNTHTFLRQKIVSVKKDPCDMVEQQTLHYLIHLRFASTKHDRIYLHTDIRLIFPQQSPDVASSKLQVLTNGPCEPKYTPRDR